MNLYELLRELKLCRRFLTPQQYRTLKGQAEWLAQHRALWEAEKSPSKPKTAKRTNSKSK